MWCPFGNKKCRGVECGNFNDPDSKFGVKSKPKGCKGDNPTAQWSRWYLRRFCNDTTTEDNSQKGGD